MTKTEVMAVLKENNDERGIKHWKKLGDYTGGLKSFGIGLTKLRKIAKQIGRYHKLALQLWNTKNHDAKIVGLLIDDPKQLTRDQVEEQVEEVDAGMLSHVFNSCDATLPKASFALEAAKDWIVAKDEVRSRCGRGLIYELSKNMRKKELTDEFFLDCLKKIHADIDDEENWVRASMGGAIIGIGKRSKKLNKACVKLAKRIGPIEYEDTGESNCEPLDMLKHLTSDYIRKKLGL